MGVGVCISVAMSLAGHATPSTGRRAGPARQWRYRACTRAAVPARDRPRLENAVRVDRAIRFLQLGSRHSVRRAVGRLRTRSHESRDSSAVPCRELAWGRVAA